MLSLFSGRGLVFNKGKGLNNAFYCSGRGFVVFNKGEGEGLNNAFYFRGEG